MSTATTPKKPTEESGERAQPFSDSDLREVAGLDSKLPAVIEPQVAAGIPANKQPDFLMGMATSDRAIHNFTGNKMEVFAMVNQATGPDCVTGSATIGEVIQLTHYYVHPVMVAKDEDTKPVRVPRSVLFDADGTAYAFCSQGIADSLNQLLQCLEGKIPEDGLPMTIVQSDTRSGNRTFSLRYSPDVA